MSRRIVSWIFCLTVLCQGNVFSGHSTEVFDIGKYKIRITFFSPVVVRVRISASDTFYTGEDAEFTLYDDEGDTYDYEKHLCIQIPIRWNEERKMLTLGAQIGSYHGAPVQRTFHIVLVGADHGVGVESTANPDKIITYRQKAMTIKLKR